MLKFFKKNKHFIFLACIIFFGAYFRLNNFHDLVRFNDDQARDSQIINKMIENNDFPLLGPKAGGTKFNLGPAFYYLEYLSALTFGNNPAGVAFFVVILAILSIPLLFYFLNLYFTKNISLFLTFFYAISFYMIKYSRFVWNPNVIPFFILILLISFFKIIENKNDKINRWYLILGITAGILIQLHTLLLATIPIIILIFFIYLWLKHKTKKIIGFFAVFFIALVLNLPFFIYDIKNNGENFKLFFKATEKKTEKSSSVVDNFFKNGQFFVQSNIYILSGFEPQKDWTNVQKFFKKENFKEIIAVFFGIVFLFFGLTLAFLNFKKEKEEKRRFFLGFFLLMFFLYFLIFFPISNVLQSRLFIVCFIIPFVSIGLIIEFIINKLSRKELYFSIFSAVAILLVYSNSVTYKKAYDFTDYANKGDIYGGISLKETKEISRFIIQSSKTEELANKKFYLLPFKFNKSVAFLNKEAGLKTSILNNSSIAKNGQEAVLIYLGKSKNKESIINKNSKRFNYIDSETIGRFEVFLFQNK